MTITLSIGLGKPGIGALSVGALGVVDPPQETAFVYVSATQPTFLLRGDRLLCGDRLPPPPR